MRNARLPGPWRLLFGSAILTLSACSLAPHYVRPAVAVPASFQASGQADIDGVTAPSSTVWHAFGDTTLDELIGTALTHNKTLEQATAQLNEARALRGLEAFALLPTVTAAGSRDRSRPSGRDPFVPRSVGRTSVYKAGFDASWEIDLFGGARSASRAARAEQGAAEAGVDAARQAVVAEVAQAYFSLRAEQERLRVQRRNVANLGENLHLIEARVAAGRGSELDVARTRALTLGTAARLPQTEAAIGRDEQRLATLTAQPIDKVRETLGAARPIPPMPALVAVGTPDAWLRRRPDVRQAEKRLEAATAKIGIDKAEYLPRLTLLGGFGWTGQATADLGSSAAQRWHYGPALTWSFLDIGRVHQRVRASEARAAGAAAAYQDTVLRALEETENAMAGYRAANEAAITLGSAVTASRSATDLANARLGAGAVDTLVVLDAERSQLDLEDQLATAQSQRATSLAALYKALAGDFGAMP